MLIVLKNPDYNILSTGKHDLSNYHGNFLLATQMHENLRAAHSSYILEGNISWAEINKCRRDKSGWIPRPEDGDWEGSEESFCVSTRSLGEYPVLVRLRPADTQTAVPTAGRFTMILF